MSVLSNALKGKILQERRAGKYLCVGGNERGSPYYPSDFDPYIYSLELSARFSTSIFIDNSQKGSEGSPNRTEVERTMKHAIIESVFSEFRQPLWDLKVKIVDRNSEVNDILKIVSDIEKQMFDVD